MRSALLESIVGRFEAPQKSGNGYLVRCVAHEDRKPSLHISLSDDGSRVLLKCHAGCETADIVAKAGFSFPELFDQELRKRAKGKGPDTYVETPYDYKLNGKLLFQTNRKQYADHKTFTIRRPKPGGGWEYSLGDTRPVLYHADEVHAAIEQSEWVDAVEGEKSADRLRALGFNATTNPLGAGKWRPEYADDLFGAAVAIFCDDDQPGYKHAYGIATSLERKAEAIRIIRIIGLPPKSDISDYIALVGADRAAVDIEAIVQGVVEALPGLQAITLEELAELAGIASDQAQAEQVAGPIGNHIVWSRFSEIEEEAIRWIWRDWIAAGKLHLLAGVQGDGKSTVLAAIMAMLSRGAILPDGSRVKPKRVGFLISEDGVADTVLPRLRLHGANLDNIFYLKSVRTDEGERPISLSEDRELIRQFVVENQLDVLNIDALSDFMGSAKRNDDGEVRAVLTPLGQMGNDTGCAMIGIVHLGKPGASARRAIERVLGSGAFTQVARIVWAVSVDPDDDTKRYLGSIKNNLAPEVPTLAWHRNRDAAIAWDGIAATSVKNIMGGSHEKASKVDAAREFLKDFLKGGGKFTADVLAAGKTKGIGRNALYEAADELDVSKEKDNREPNGRTYWRLPAGPPPPMDRERSWVCSVSSTTTGSSVSTNGRANPELPQLPDLFGVPDVAIQPLSGVAAGSAVPEDEEAF